MNEEVHYRLLKILESAPNKGQRQLAQELGYSLGKVNYCLKALMDKGLVKMDNFCHSESKRAYVYKLTPAGLQEKAAVTLRFLKRKLAEYEQIKSEIAQLKQEVEPLENV